LAPLDRLGSARSVNNTPSSYYPFGEDKSTNPAIDAWKFGSYWRYSASGLDYATNRYYSSSLSRFLTPDLFGGSEAGLNPQSWNRYSYSLNDPVNYFDPTGKNAVCVTKVDEGDDDSSTECFGGDGSGGSGSGSGGIALPQWQQALNLARVIAVSVIGTLASDSNCQNDIDALGKESQSVKGATAIDDDTLIQALVDANYQNGLTATAAASTLNDPMINARPNVANGPISNLFIPGTEAESQLGGNTVYFRPSYVLGLSPYGLAALIAHETLHNLGLNDPQVEAGLGLTSQQCQVSNCITIKLDMDCFQPPGPTLLGMP
jgi:RHS repeat-associated protein